MLEAPPSTFHPPSFTLLPSMCGIALLDGSQKDIAPLQKVLSQRGPDLTNVCSVTEELTLIGCVLHIQGIQLTPQPCSDEEGNLLLWNGEVFGICNPEEEGSSLDNPSGNHEANHGESDTIMVSRLIQKAISMVILQDEYNVYDDDTTRTHLLLQLGTFIATALSTISGPYAFIYYCKKFQCFFYGRDPFGRRSLLIKQSQIHGKVHVVASVRPLEEEEENDMNSSLEETSTSCSSSKWIDVPVQGIYVSSIVHKDTPPLLIPWPIHRLRLGYPSISSNRLITKPSSPILLPWQQLLAALKHAIKIRITCVKGYNHHVTSSPTSSSSSSPSSSPPSSSSSSSSSSTIPSRAARIGVLFSGGIDSVVLAAIAHLSMDDEHEPIDLLNVSFVGSTDDDVVSPDRLAAVAALDELQQLYPTRDWRLVHVDVSSSQVSTASFLLFFFPSFLLMFHQE